MKNTKSKALAKKAGKKSDADKFDRNKFTKTNEERYYPAYRKSILKKTDK